MKKLFKECLLLVNALILFALFGLIYADSNISRKQQNPVKLAAIEISEIKNADSTPYISYLKQNAKPPVEYVLNKFKDHDVVILGEMHGIKEYLELIRDIIEPLYYEGGVKLFAMEIIKTKNTALVNRLVTGKEYDQQLALRIFRDCAWPTWGFKEYMDIIKAIWGLNNKLPPKAKKIRVVALDSDWDAYDFVSGNWSEADEKARDNHMAAVLAREVLDKGEKALVQIGFNHTFIRYRLPKIKNEKFVGERAPRFGYILHDKYGDRIFQICLHHNMQSGEKASQPVLIEFVERIFKSNDNHPVGFDVKKSPFAGLRDRGTLLFAFREKVMLSDITQGYIFLKPIEQLSRATWVKGFIDQSNFEKAKAVAFRRGWAKPEECDTPEKLDKTLKWSFEGPPLLPNNEKYARLSPKQAARALLQACGNENWDEVLKFWPKPSLDQKFKDYYGGLITIRIGEPFRKGGYIGWLIPYEIKLKTGEIKKFNLAMRNDNSAKRYIWDGGLFWKK